MNLLILIIMVTPALLRQTRHRTQTPPPYFLHFLLVQYFQIPIHSYYTLQLDLENDEAVYLHTLDL